MSSNSSMIVRAEDKTPEVTIVESDFGELERLKRTPQQFHGGMEQSPYSRDDIIRGSLIGSE